MVVDKSVELLEDLVRFLNRKQSFYLKLYDEYVNGDLSDYSHLDDSRKDETDCEGVCEDLIECIKAISNEAQYRGFAKKEKLLCTVDGQDEAMYLFDEWLLKVVRLLDDKTIRLAPVEGEGINGTFYAILFRLTWYVNTLRDLATKTEDEYYGGRRTDVMPYYIGESKLKETSTILLTSHHKTELPKSTSTRTRSGCTACGDNSPDKVLQPLKYWCDDFNIDDFSEPEDDERICVDCFKDICKSLGVSLKKKRRRMKEGVGNIDINNSIVETFEDIARKYGLRVGFDYNEGGSGKVLVFSDCPLEDGVDIEMREELQSALPNYKVYSYVSGDAWLTRGVHKNEVTFVVNYEMYESHSNKPFEYNWETINGEKALVLQQYSENDVW